MGRLIMVKFRRMVMYELEEISRDGNTITARMIPMKEIRYYKDGHLVIEYVSSKDDRQQYGQLKGKDE